MTVRPLGPLFDSLEERIKKKEIISRIARKQFDGDVYLVGGAIREIVLDRSPRDYDFVIDNGKDLRSFETAFSASSFILGKAYSDPQDRHKGYIPGHKPVSRPDRE